MDELQSILQGLTKEEQQAVIQILQEQAKTGSSSSYNSLISADYDEIPVSIEEFISNPRYAGNYLQVYYPFWKEQLINIFDRGKHYSEIAFTGCLYGDTLIYVNDKLETIESFYNRYKHNDLNNGKNVIATTRCYDSDNNKFTVGNITHVFYTGENAVYAILFSDGNLIVCTKDHPFLTVENNWVTIDSGLSINSRIRANNSCGYLDVVSIEYQTIGRTYDITVDNYHNFEIGKPAVISSNSIGTGKSSMAIVGMAYVLYQLMCLKNPQKYWGTNKTMYFAFFNNNLDLAKSVGFAAFHDLIRKSEWFLENGEFRGKVNQVYHPYKDIQLMAGSLPSHVIGKDVFCLTGDTVICTNRGYIRLDRLVGKTFRVNQAVDNSSRCILSDECIAVKTKTVYELFELILENGSIIKCTADHKFRNNRSWYQPANTFVPGDYLYSDNGNIKIIETRHHEVTDGVDVYDIVNAYPYNNFGIVARDHIVFAHNCALQDELNFGQGSSVHLEQNKILSTYNNIYERIASRFTRDGTNWGTMFLVSSKKSEYDFLETYIRKQKGKPHFYVADAKLWDVKPMGMYSGKKFNLAVGGSNLPSKIIPDNEDPHEYVLQGYDVIQVPIEHKQSFELDMQSAIMNVAGISITQFMKFMNIDQIQKCYTTDENPFTQEVIPIGLNDSTLISDYFRPELVPEAIYSRPIFIHLDMAVSGDNAGIGAVASMGFVNTSEYDIGQGKVVDTRKMAYRHVFSVGISAPKNDQIHFAKVREFLYWLKFHLGWNIRGISADGFNCLTENNKVITDKGFVGIKDLDNSLYKVLSYDSKEKRFVFTDFEPVRQSGTAFALVQIYFFDGSYIECTENHLIYTENKGEYKYKSAKDIQTGDYVYGITGSHFVKHIEIRKVDATPVYDIEVPEYNNFVLSNGSVVHNSVDMRQQLSTMGFNDVSLVSLDRTPDGYMALRSAIAEKRIALLKLQHLEVELVQLERDNVTGKIDHPVNGCFTADTKISLVDGREITLSQLKTEFESGHDNFVYSINEVTHEIEPKIVTNVFYTKTVDMLCVITLDNGEIIRCTPDHRFMLRDGTYVQAQCLTHDDSLMPLYRKVSNNGLSGYRLYYDPSDNSCHYEHRKFVGCKVPKGMVVHHKDYNKLNNSPENLKVMTVKEHTSFHNRNQSESERHKRSMSIKHWHEKNIGTEIYRKRSNAISCKLRIRNNTVYRNLVTVLRRHMLNTYIQSTLGKTYDQCTLSEINSCSVKLSRYLNPKIQQSITAAIIQNHKKGKYLNAYNALKAYNDSHRGVSRPREFKDKLISIMNSEKVKKKQRDFIDSLAAEQRSKIYGSAKGKHWYNNGIKEVLVNDDEVPEGFVLGRINHKVVSIEIKQCYPTQVFDISVEGNPNFALTAGVFVHNSKDESDGLAGALYNALLHEKDLANDMSDLVETMVEMNQVIPSTVQIVTTQQVDNSTDPQKMTKEEIIAEAKRRATFQYGRERVGYRDEDDEPFNPSEGILL